MRTKALILSAALCAISAASTLAQVYSINVVGYMSVTVTNNYALIANQLTDLQLNYATNHVAPASVPQGTQISKFNPTTGGYATLTRQTNSAGTPIWTGTTTALAMTIEPGAGVFVKKAPSLGAAPMTITFVGEVMQNTLVNPLTTGYDIYSSMVPQVGGVKTVHEYPALHGDQVFRFIPSSGAYQTRTFQTNVVGFPDGVWNPSEPVIGVGEAFWVKTLYPNRDWVRNFTVQ